MARKGYSVFADVLQTTADGRDLGDLYDELRAAADIQNEQQQNFLSLFTYPATSGVTSVLQTVGDHTTSIRPALPPPRRVGQPHTSRPRASSAWYTLN